MLKNAYLLATIGADTAENEPNFEEGQQPRDLRRRALLHLEDAEAAGNLCAFLPRLACKKGFSRSS